MSALFIAASGINAASTELRVISNDMANANTLGYKEARAEFADLFRFSFNSNPATASGVGVQVSAVTQKFSQGSLQLTDNALDVAIEGNGFFVMETPSGQELYGRAGAFQINDDGFIVDSKGNFVIGLKPEYDFIPNNLVDENIDFATFSGAGAALGNDLWGYDDDGTGTGEVNNNAPFLSIGLNSVGNPINTNLSYAFQFGDTTGDGTSDGPQVLKDSQGNFLLYLNRQDLDGAGDGGSNGQTAPAAGSIDINGDGVVDPSFGGTDFIPRDGYYVVDPVSRDPVTGQITQFQLRLRDDTDGDGLKDAGPIFATPELDTEPNYGRQTAPIQIASPEDPAGFTFPTNTTDDEALVPLTKDVAGVQITANGEVTIIKQDGSTQVVGYFILKDFTNPQGLTKVGSNLWQASPSSGDPIRFEDPNNAANSFAFARPGDRGARLGRLASGGLEQSNVDITKELINLITAQRFYQANSKVIETDEQAVQTLLRQ